MNDTAVIPQDVVEVADSMEGDLMSFFKILLNTAIVTAVASGVYYYLDQNSRRNAETAEDPDDAPGPLDRENIKDAADRAYTSIRHSTDEAYATIRKSVGPQGEEIMDDVAEAAGKVCETVTYAGRKVGDIVTDSDSNVQEKASAVADTFRYAAADLAAKFAKEDEPDAVEGVILPVESDFAEDAEDVQAEPETEHAEETTPDVEVYLDTDAAETAGETVPESVTPADESCFAEDAEAETVAQPATDTAQIEEFFDDGDAN